MEELPATEMSVDQQLEIIMEHFCTRILRRKYRPTGVENDSISTRSCKQEYCDRMRLACEKTKRGEELDAAEWFAWCKTFSKDWKQYCVWLSPKKQREYLSANIGANWYNIDAVHSWKKEEDEEGDVPQNGGTVPSASCLQKPVVDMIPLAIPLNHPAMSNVVVPMQPQLVPAPIAYPQAFLNQQQPQTQQLNAIPIATPCTFQPQQLWQSYATPAMQFDQRIQTFTGGYLGGLR